MLNYPAKQSAGDFEPVPSGTHIAICNLVVDIGIQPGSGMYPNPKRQVVIRFEIPSEQIEFEKEGKKQVGPAVISKTYTASMNEKANLRKDLEGWRGKSFTDEEAEKFDVASVLGKPCMLSITHVEKGDKTYANITGISKLMKGIDPKTMIPAVTPLYYGPDNIKMYQQLPDWLRKKIDTQIIPEKSKQDEEPPADAYEGAADGTEITDDDIPF